MLLTESNEICCVSSCKLVKSQSLIVMVHVLEKVATTGISQYGQFYMNK